MPKEAKIEKNHFGLESGGLTDIFNTVKYQNFMYLVNTCILSSI